MRKITLAATALFAVTGFSQVQENDRAFFGPDNPIMCGQHIQQEKYYESHPEHRALDSVDQVNFQAEYEEFLANEFDPNARVSYTIPVVVHVAHIGGVDNISDEQIYDAINRLNEDFQMLNNDVNNTVAAFTSIIGDADIDFKLATRDPNGNCHSGITRTFTTNTNHDGGSGLVSDIVAEHGYWPASDYMNIFVCQDPAGAAGYTYNPSNWNDGMEAGIYMRHDYMGTIGTSSNTGRHTLSHEAGHWLNLSHPWGGNNNPGNNGSCGTDDGVSDTPNTIGWTSCNTAGSTCNSLDNVQNIMEYSYCSTMFTQGQVARMHNALNSGVADRNNLSTASNLSATGTDGPGDICEAQFSSDLRYICAGQSIEFYDQSFHNVQTRSWTFNGGTPASSTAEQPVVTYNTPGVYSVSLTVSDGSNNESITQSNYIIVLGNPGESLPYTEDFEDLSVIPDNENWMVVDYSGSDPWLLTGQAGSQGSSKSAKLLNYGNSEASDDELISGTIDLGGVDPSDDMIFNFDYAYRKRYSSNDEWLKFYISKDCGETWVLRKNIHGDGLSDVVSTSSYTPAGEEDWYTVDVTNINADYYVSDFRFKFVFESDNGNNIYIDNINMYPSSMSDIQSSSSANTLIVYPNPSSDLTTIELSAKEGIDYDITVLNTLGQQVDEVYSGALSNGLNKIQYNAADLSKGIYVVRIESEGKAQTVKFIKE